MPRPALSRFFQILLLLVIISVFAPHGHGQPQVAVENRDERVVAVVPMIGAGTAADPKRPMFVPWGPNAHKDLLESGILSFSFQLSDDGRSAIVEFVARDRKALAPILNANRADVKAFVRGQDSRQTIDTELRRHKRDIDLDQVVHPRHKAAATWTAPAAGGGQ